MRSIFAWAKFAKSTLTVENRLSVDSFNMPTYEAPVTYQAVVQRTRSEQRAARTEEAKLNLAVYLLGADLIYPTARLTLTTDDVGSTESWAINPTIQSINRFYDEHGAHHTVLYL